ncbi:MAG: hypothetical protein B7Z66_13295 [Chromatiales bacterium 21-64-14]|nr:MAG: hypothetical protein B7Z66_13295 [Chromatiales bacterium 21-64-14]HQU16909.1 DUF3138 family protein [Gammaproteobacteria bacterium]
MSQARSLHSRHTHALTLLGVALLTIPGFAAADESLSQQVSTLTAKVNQLEGPAGLLSGITVSGYIDPTYIYNRQQNIASFFFGDKNAPYTFYHSTFGDLFLDVNKKFAGGSSIDIQIMPNRGYGAASGSIINAANFTVPVTDKFSVIGGQIPAWDGYESETSTSMYTVTHNLLYDFSEPGFFTGAGGQYATGPYTAQVLIANTWNTTFNTSFREPTLEYRFSVAPTSSFSYGLYGTIGKVATANPATIGPTTRYFNDLDATYASGPVTLSGQFDHGYQDRGAANGQAAEWYGFSLLGNYKIMPMVGATLRYDYLDDTKNGGHIVGDFQDGFITDPTNPNEGTRRQALTTALLFYPAKYLTVKLEYRHDWANIAAFQSATNGTFHKSDDTVAAQFLFAF